MSLQVRGLRFTYPGWPATLGGVDLEVLDGQCVFLLGPSGTGKSTVLSCIAGLLPGYQGTIHLAGQALDALPAHRRHVGMMFQEPALFPHLNVWRNVAFGLPYRGVPKAARRAEALHWLELVGLADRAEGHVDELSGGQRQRVALARTLAAKPRAVLLDEPLSNLDPGLRLELGQKVRDLLAAQGVAALWVTHDEDEAKRLGDRVLRLADGRVQDGNPPFNAGTA